MPLLLLTIVGAVPAQLLIDTPAQQIVDSLPRESGALLAYYTQIWAPAVVLLLIWPLVAQPWTRRWVGHTAASGGIPSRVYPLAALFIAAVFVGLRLGAP